MLRKSAAAAVAQHHAFDPRAHRPLLGLLGYARSAMLRIASRSNPTYILRAIQSITAPGASRFIAAAKYVGTVT
jgi:hypothetical protein